MNTTRRLAQLLRDNFRTRNAVDPDAPDEAGEDLQPEIAVEVNSDGPHLYLFGAIDSWWGVGAEDLIAALAPYRGQETTHLHVNSPGGDVFEGRAMASAIVAHPGRVVCHIDGVCASAATYVAMACNHIAITQGALVMIHNGWTMAWGDKAELRAAADLLGKIDGDIAADYAKHCNVDLAQAQAWMNAETWWTADQAFEVGIVDEVASNTKRDSLAANRSTDAARWNLSAYAHAPARAPRTAQDRGGIDLAVADQLQRNRNRLRLLATV